MQFLHRDEIVAAILADAKQRIQEYAGKKVELRLFEVTKRRRLSKLEILDALCQVWGITPHAILNSKRQRELVVMRSVACFFMRSEGFTFNSIGETFHRDHTSIIHLLNSGKKLLDIEDDLFMHYYELAEPAFKYLASTDEPKQIPHEAVS